MSAQKMKLKPKGKPHLPTAIKKNAVAEQYQQNHQINY